MVELLVVVGIMSILIAVSVTSIQGLSKGGNITAAGNMLADIGSQARQHAISTNRKTALVVIKTGTADATMGETQSKIGYRTFCVMEYDPANATTPWNMVTRWQSLPPGVAIDRDENGNTKFFSNLPVTPTAPSVKHLGKSYSGTDLGYQIFQPDGSMVLPSNGAVDAKKLHIVSIRGDITSNYYDIIFNVYTGTAKVLRPEDYQ